MKPLPIIGFDRYVPRHWLNTAIAIAAGDADRNELAALLERELAGVEGRSKTSTILNRMWLSPHPALVDFSAAGVALYRTEKRSDMLGLHWGMALASHPFFAAVADSIGRLLKLHGEFTALQINRRLKEQLGDRASILRATEAVLQSLVEWQVIRGAPDRKRCFTGGPLIAVASKPRTMWMLEACVLASGKSLNPNQMSNLTFPFKLANLVEVDFNQQSRLRLAQTGAGLTVATTSP